MVFDEILGALGVDHILELIKEGLINTEEAIIAAYNVINDKIVFANDKDIDIEYYYKLEAYVKNVQKQSNNVLNEMQPGNSRVGIEEPCEAAGNNTGVGCGKILGALPTYIAQIMSSQNPQPPRMTLPVGLASNSAAHPEIVGAIRNRNVQCGGLVNEPTSRNERVDRVVVMRPSLQKRHFQIQAEGEKKIKKFYVVAKTLTFKFCDIDGSDNPILWLQNAFDEIIQHVTVKTETGV